MGTGRGGVRAALVQEQLLVSGRRLASRGAGRAGPCPGPARPRADRSGRRVRHRARPRAGPRARRAPDLRGPDIAGRRGAGGAAGRRPRRLRQPLPARHPRPRRHAKGECSVTADEVCEHAGGLLALWPGAHWAVEADADRDRPALAALRDAFGDRACGLLARHRVAGEVPREGWLRARAREIGLPWRRRPRCSTTTRLAATSRTC